MSPALPRAWLFLTHHILAGVAPHKAQGRSWAVGPSPRSSGSTWPVCSSCGIAARTVLTGTANATGPAPAVTMCELTPMTAPPASSSGPPALPARRPRPSGSRRRRRAVGASSRWPMADTTPVVSVLAAPVGLPSATVGSPTCTRVRVAQRQRLAGRAPRVDLRAARGRCTSSVPSARARTVRPSASVTLMSVAARITCALVRIRPPSSNTKPAPVVSPSAAGRPGRSPSGRRHRARAHEHDARAPRGGRVGRARARSRRLAERGRAWPGPARRRVVRVSPSGSPMPSSTSAVTPLPIAAASTVPIHCRLTIPQGGPGP